MNALKYIFLEFHESDPFQNTLHKQSTDICYNDAQFIYQCHTVLAALVDQLNKSEHTMEFIY